MATQSVSSSVEIESDRPLEEAHVRLLAKHAPGTHQRRVRWSGGETQVLELGAGGPPVVLIHGGLGDAFQWAPIMPALARRFHVYAVDRPGHGLADPFDYTQVDFPALGRTFLGEVLDALGLSTVSIVANSMGGYWSIFYAIAAPARVSHLMLVGTPAGTKREIPLQLRMTQWPLFGALIRSFMSKPTRESTRDFWKQICVAHPERLDDELLDAVACSQRRNISSWFSLMECMMDAGGFRRELVIGERWKALQVPVVFLWGEKDAFDSPAHGERIATHIPAGGRLVRIPDAGHLPWLDDPARVISEIERAIEM
jgi:pimeloyl-ACP methyl ester carboxylesterase